MIRDGVIVDTSVLIAFFKGESEYIEKVNRLLQDNRLVVTGIIIAEFLQGLKGFREEQRISDLLAALTSIELTTELWVKTGKMSLSLRRKGINLPLTDIAIAILALEYDLALFTLDNHFTHIPNLKLYLL